MKLSTFIGIFLIILGGWLLFQGLTQPNANPQEITTRDQEVVISHEQDSESMWRNYSGIICIVGGSILVAAPLFRNNRKVST